MKVNLPAGQEGELPSMIIEMCSQERTYGKFFGLISERFSRLNRLWKELFENAFAHYYDTIHRYETNRLRNIARLFGHLISSDAIGWHVLSIIHLNEEETTSSSRIFIKILFQDLAEAMGMGGLQIRLKDDILRPSFEGIFPMDNANPRNTRFAINYFTSIGMGGLTEGMREHLQNAPKPAPIALPPPASASSSRSSSVSSYSSYTSSSRSRSYSRSRSPSRDRRGGRPARSLSRSVTPPPRRNGRSLTPPRRGRNRSLTPPRHNLNNGHRRGRSPSRSSSYSSSSSRSPPPPRRRPARPYSSSRSRSPPARQRKRAAESVSRSPPIRRRGRSPSSSRSLPPARRRRGADEVSRSPVRRRRNSSSSSRSRAPVGRRRR